MCNILGKLQLSAYSNPEIQQIHFLWLHSHFLLEQILILDIQANKTKIVEDCSIYLVLFVSYVRNKHHWPLLPCL